MKIIRFTGITGFLLLITAAVLMGQSLADRLRTPLYFSTALSIGYDENLLKFSELEKQNAANSPEIMGDLETFDSSVLRPEIRLNYSPVFFQEHATNFIFGAAYSSYQQSSAKSYSSYVFKFEQHLANYSWLKIYYSLAPEYYLRSYRDRDKINADRMDCFFDSENLYMTYSFPVIKKSWMQVKLSRKRQYYNPAFTEFDTEIKAGELRIYSSRVRGLRLSVWYSVGKGDNVSYDSGYYTTGNDRSYDYYQTGGSVYYYPGKWLDKVALSIRGDRRDYLTDSAEDPLHAGRRHLDLQTSFWLDKSLTNDVTAQLRFVYSDKTTVSKYDWVEELKTYSRFQIWLKFSYDFYLDILY